MNASTSCADAMIAAPEAIITREPNRSSNTPAGICMLAYTTICRTTNPESTAGVMSKRSVAARPDTPNDVRCMTATT